MSCSIIRLMVILIQNIYVVISFFCNNTEYWCRQPNLGMKYFNAEFISLTQTDYKACIIHCNEIRHLNLKLQF